MPSVVASDSFCKHSQRPCAGRQDSLCGALPWQLELLQARGSRDCLFRREGGGESFRGFCEVVLCPFYVLPYSFPLHSACHHFGPLTVAIGHQPPWQSLHQGAHGPTFHNTEISLSHNVHQNHSFWLTHILFLALCCLLCLKLVNGSHASQVGLAALEGAW